MNPKIRVIIFAVGGAAIGVSAAVDIADERYGLAVISALLACWIIMDRADDALPDAWLLAVLVIGYVVGNRGFAQLQPSQNIPLLPAEAFLMVAVPALIARVTFKRATAFRKDVLNTAIILWVLMGAIRLPLDIERFGVLALRDYAMCYYAAFFFIAQAFGNHPASSRLLTRSITAAFVLLMPVVIFNQIFPDFLADNFTLRGIPVIYHKSDLIATSLAAGFFWLWTRIEKSGNRLWFIPAATSLLLIGVMASPRAAMTAIAVTSAIWLLKGRWRIVAAQFGIISVAAVLAVAVISLSGKDLKTSVPYSMYEHAISIFDPAGSGSYINGESGNPGDNNRFRVIWWRDVINTTLNENAALGQGFGADLSTQFLADYDLLGDESFSARSPHSMVVTVFGRMGFIGLILWMVVAFGIGRLVWRLFGMGEPDGVALACVVCVVWVSACFGVVLEGPMGAVLFWTALGLASSRAAQGALSNVPALEAAVAGASRRDWPVAKAGAFDTQSTNQ